MNFWFWNTTTKKMKPKSDKTKTKSKITNNKIKSTKNKTRRSKKGGADTASEDTSPPAYKERYDEFVSEMKSK